MNTIATNSRGRRWRHHLGHALCLIALSIFAACGGGGGGGDAPPDGGGGGGSGGGGSGGGGGSTDAIAQSLGDMGLSTAETPRVDDDQDTLPESYSPLGASATLDKFDEIMLLGMELDYPGANDSLTATVKMQPGSGFSYTMDVLNQPEFSTTPWALSRGNLPGDVRAAACADIDADGLDETVVAYQTGSDRFVRLLYMDDGENGFAIIDEQFIVAEAEAQGIAIAAGDFDGDGDKDVAVGLMLDTSVEVIRVDSDAGTFQLTGVVHSFALQASAAQMHVTMEACNLDYDAGQELALVVNESYNKTSSSSYRDGNSRYAIIDDAGNGYASLRTGTVETTIGVDRYTADIGDLAVGDIDGDTLDEVLFAGVSGRGRTNNTISKPRGYLMFALDDAKRDFAPMGANWWRYRNPTNNDNESGVGYHLDYCHINTVDLDGDGAHEVHVNQLVYGDWASNGPWVQIHEIPFVDLVFPDQSGSFWFSWQTTAMSTGDVTQDKRQDIVFKAPTQRYVKVWGLHEVNGWSEIAEIPTRFSNSQDALHPQLVLSNVDRDSLALDYSEGSYKLIFTEPVVIAALAAAPSGEGQDPGSASTVFGQGTSTSVSTENSYTVTAGVSAGFSTSFSVFGVEVGAFEAIGTIKGSASRSTSQAYTLTRRILWESVNEDSVIFTSIPYDQYTYKILSHPNPKLIGTEVVVSLPRRPMETMVPRSLYNDAVTGDAPRIDSGVFGHTVGVPSSYPTGSQKDSIVRSRDGLASVPADIGAGNGTVTVEVNVYEEAGRTTSYGASFELDVKGTAGGVVAGFSAGYSSENSLSIISGKESIYQAKVGLLDPDFFPQNAFTWGLFTYVHEDSGSKQQFEVINFWVDPQ